MVYIIEDTYRYTIGPALAFFLLIRKLLRHQFVPVVFLNHETPIPGPGIFHRKLHHLVNEFVQHNFTAQYFGGFNDGPGIKLVCRKCVAVLRSPVIAFFLLLQLRVFGFPGIDDTVHLKVRQVCFNGTKIIIRSIQFEVTIAVIPAPKGGEILIRKFFEPLGYKVELIRHQLDSKFPEWGDSKYFTLKLNHTITTKELLSHLYVLIPTLDNDKHYFVSENEIEKLMQKGEGWLKDHPEKEQIIRRYLINLNSLSRQALERLSEGEEIGDLSDELVEKTEKQKRKETLHDKRIKLVAEKITESGAERVLDLGCGEGKLIRQLIKQKQFSEIVGMDVSYNELIKAKERLHFEEMSPKQKERINLFQGSLTYKDQRLEGFDAAAVVEVIEHLDLNRLKAFERVLFEFAKPKTVVLTTPNQEFNVMWDKLDAEEMRHDDHRFEWTRKEFLEWSNKIGETYNYKVELFPIGDEVENIGAPSQMAIFTYGN